MGTMYNILDNYRSLLEALKGMPPSREISLAITKLEESIMWYEKNESTVQSNA